MRGGRDLNPQPPAWQAGALTKLSYRRMYCDSASGGEYISFIQFLQWYTAVINMKILLIRHGETTGDIEDRYGGMHDDNWGSW